MTPTLSAAAAFLKSLDALRDEDAELIASANVSQEPRARRAARNGYLLRHALIRFIAFEVGAQQNHRAAKPQSLTPGKGNPGQ